MKARVVTISTLTPPTICAIERTPRKEARSQETLDMVLACTTEIMMNLFKTKVSPSDSKGPRWTGPSVSRAEQRKHNRELNSIPLRHLLFELGMYPGDPTPRLRRYLQRRGKSTDPRTMMTPKQCRRIRRFMARGQRDISHMVWGIIVFNILTIGICLCL